MRVNYGHCKVSATIAPRVFALLLAVLFFALPARAETVRIVVVGDSLSAGYRLPPGESFPERLQWALSNQGIDVEIIGAGVSGDTTSGGLARLDWSVGKNVDGVILELGANDALRGLPVDLARKNLAAMLARLKQRKIGVLLAGMRAPPNMGEDYQRAFDAIYPALAKQYDVALYPFFLDGVATREALNLDDGIHPNKAGIAVMVKRFLPHAKRFINTLKTTR